MIHASSASQRQEPPETIEDTEQIEETEQTPPTRAQQWAVVSELRERPGAGPVAFLTHWALRPREDDQVEAHTDEDSPTRNDHAAAEPSPALPPLDLLRTVAGRWMRLWAQEENDQPPLLAFRVAAALSPQEVSAWCPGATIRLYTLGGPVAPLPDTALSEEPLARYSVVLAPTMSFWPELRALIEAQEHEQPGMDRGEDGKHDLDLLEQELAFWLASPHGLIVNLYEGEDLVGHLSLARQRDETEGCDGWGIIALHVARCARGQQLSVLLQRVAATLLVTRRMARQATQMLPAVRAVPAKAEASSEAADTPFAGSGDTAENEAPAAQDALPADEDAASEEAASAAPPETSQSEPVSTVLEQPWPYFFGFIPPNNLPALRGAYAAGRQIIGAYVDVPVAALEKQE
jgi:hypothetical protein